MKPRLLSCVAVFSAIFAMPWVAFAQETVISGTVVDATDAVLPGVTVTAVHVDSGNTFTSVTDARGEYRIGALRTGRYRITAELPGFTTATRDNVEMLLGQRAMLAFRMSPSTVQETVTVTGAAPLIDTTQSKMGGNIDPRQMQELPVNGRNWLDLAMLAKGATANASGDVPTTGTPQAADSRFQINVDGQQVTQAILGVLGQPRFSRDSIGEFELVSNRFDATQGRSMGLQINAITKAGTNRFAGSTAGYFRDDRFNAEDFVAHRVLPYSNQQLVGTFGGPIRRDRAHFFGYYEYEREPRTFFFTSPFPSFNAVDFSDVRREDKYGGRFDQRLGGSTSLMLRANRFFLDLPNEPQRTGGAVFHPSSGGGGERQTNQFFGTLTQVLSNDVVNEVKGGYNYYRQFLNTVPGLENSPRISLRGYNIGASPDWPQDLVQHTTSMRDDLTLLFAGGGRHELKVGGEYLYNLTEFQDWALGRRGILVASGGPIPPNIESLFPVWNDPSTWNIGALSPISVRYIVPVGTFVFEDPKHIGAAWLQDNWAVTQDLTLNLGLRYDVSIGALGEHLIHELLPEKRSSDTLNFQPRLGFAYSLGDKTVVRGGFGKYFAEPNDSINWQAQASILTQQVIVANDGRPNFALDPFNGRPPTFEEASRLPTRGTVQAIPGPDVHTPYSWQSSIGVQREIAEAMAVEADYVYTGGRREMYARQANVTYNPLTGGNNPWANASTRLYPTWGSVRRNYTDGWSNTHALQLGYTKRFTQNYQLQATYTLSQFKNAVGVPTGSELVCQVPGSAPGPCPAGFQVAPDLGGEYTNAPGEQRHRAVINGIWQLPYEFQLSGLYFYGSGERYAINTGSDLRDLGPSFNPLQGAGFVPGRFSANGTIIPRTIVGTPLHRVDLRIMRSFRFGDHFKIDGIAEVFNVLNHENYGTFVVVTSSPLFGRPAQNSNVAYQPRMAQFGFRFEF